MTAALRHREFRLLFLGQAISAVGDQVFPVAVTVLVLDRGGGAAQLGLVLAARFASLVLFSLFGGVWADRLPRVRVMVGADSARLVAVLGLALSASGSAPAAVLSALVFFVGAGEAFFRPAYGALIPDVLPAGQLAAGNALSGAAAQLARVVGPGLAGVLVAAAGPRGALLGDAFTFAVSLASLAVLREPARARRARLPELREIGAGVGAVRARPWIGAVLLLATTQLLLVVPAATVLLPIAVRDGGSPSGVYGYVLALGALGGVGGAVLAGRWRPSRPGVVAVGACVAIAAQPAALLVRPHAWGLAAAWFASNLGLGVFLVHWETALQADVPRELLARVISVDWMCSLAFLPVGLALVGPAVSAAGRGAVLAVAVVAGTVPPLICLRVPGVPEFRSAPTGHDR